MKALKIAAVLFLSVPMTLAIGVAYLFGAAIRWINKERKPEPDLEEEEPNIVRLHPKPEDKLWPY